VSWYQKGKIDLDITEARDSEWKWHQLGNMQVCTSLQTDNHASTPPLSFYIQAGCLSCHPTNRVKALRNREQKCADTIGWPFPMLKYKYIFQVKYMEAILSNSTQKLLWFKITKMLTAVLK